MCRAEVQWISHQSVVTVKVDSFLLQYISINASSSPTNRQSGTADEKSVPSSRIDKRISGRKCCNP